MELVAITIALTSLVINLYLVRRFTGSITVDVHLPEQTVPNIEVSVCSEPEEKLPSVPKVDESKKAWRNQKGIPINETKYVPSSGNAPPKPGPRERPSGFAR